MEWLSFIGAVNEQQFLFEKLNNFAGEPCLSKDMEGALHPLKIKNNDGFYSGAALEQTLRNFS